MRAQCIYESEFLNLEDFLYKQTLEIKLDYFHEIRIEKDFSRKPYRVVLPPTINM
jgi:hypothetical protein